MVLEAVLAQLGQISISTVKRILTRLRQDERRLPRRKPQQTMRLLQDIPALRLPWDVQEPGPGHFEVDLEHHGGPSSTGEYLHTLQMIDVATGWSERVAVLGRSALVMEAAFQRILTRLPFPIIELHPDNGSEFLNYHLLNFFKAAVKGVRISRSRPWRKNDNCHVEQRNNSLVRACLGYDRLDSVPQALAANQLYDQMWLYYNFFQPVLHISAKTLVVNEGQRPHVKRRYDTASTPFDRLGQANGLPAERLSFPSLVLIIVSVSGPSIYNVILVMGLLGWPAVCRLVRRNALSLREREFVTAARAAGAGTSRTAFRHILPNTMGEIIVAGTFGMAAAILTEAGLSFLGLGVQPPMASWGNMLIDAQSLTILESMPWLWLPPGLMIALAVLSINFVGDGLRHALDPRRLG